jgi:hypothetical protein
MSAMSTASAARQLYSFISIPCVNVYLTGLNNNMTTSIENPIETKGTHGGARPGSGRKKGGKNHISIHDLLTSLETKTGGQKYEDLLVDDFISARNDGNKEMILKYHHLILNKVMNNLARIEVTDSEDAIVAKQLAFAEALSKLTGISQEIDTSTQAD